MDDKISLDALTTERKVYSIIADKNQYNGEVCVEDRIEGDHTKGARVVVMLPNGC